MRSTRGERVGSAWIVGFGIVTTLLVGGTACVGESPASSPGGQESSSGSQASSSGGEASSSGGGDDASTSSDGGPLSSDGGGGWTDPDASTSSSSGAPDGSPPDAAAPDAGPAEKTPPMVDPDVWLDTRLLPVVAPTNTWLDSSGNGAHAVSSALHKVNNVLGRKSIVFDADDFTPFVIPAGKLPKLSASTGLTVIMVIGHLDRPERSSQAVVFARLAKTGPAIGPDYTGVEMYLIGTANPAQLDHTFVNLFATAKRASPTAVLTGTSASLSVPHLYVLNVQNGNAKLRVDGAQVATDTVSGSLAASDNEPLAIGNYTGATNQFGFEGRMALFALYARQFTPAEIVAAELKVKADFGIP